MRFCCHHVLMCSTTPLHGCCMSWIGIFSYELCHNLLNCQWVNFTANKRSRSCWGLQLETSSLVMNLRSFITGQVFHISFIIWNTSWFLIFWKAPVQKIQVYSPCLENTVIYIEREGERVVAFPPRQSTFTIGVNLIFIVLISPNPLEVGSLSQSIPASISW